MTISKYLVRVSFASAAALLLMPLLARADAPGAPAPATVTGTIADFHGKYGIVVRDEHGTLVDVVLHQGTVIEPLGLRLERGMRVTISGIARDRTLAANRVDAPSKLRPVARIAPAEPRSDSPNPPPVPMSVYDNWGRVNPGQVPTRPEGTSEPPTPRTPQ